MHTYSVCVRVLVCISSQQRYCSPHDVWVDAKEVLKAVAFNPLPKEEVGINSKGQVDGHHNGCSSIDHILHVPRPLHAGLQRDNLARGKHLRMNLVNSYTSQVNQWGHQSTFTMSRVFVPYNKQ